MIAQVFQHVPFEDIGSIRGWLEQREAEIRYTRFFDGDNPPDVDSFDMLIVMGGPMSVTEEDRYPWLVGEKAVVRAALEAGKPVLGVCLGAQMMASALGAEIRKNPVPEIGWFPIRAVELGSEVFRCPTVPCAWPRATIAAIRRSSMASGPWACSFTWSAMPKVSRAWSTIVQTSWWPECPRSKAPRRSWRLRPHATKC